MGLYNYKKSIQTAEQRIIEADYSQKNKDTIFAFVNVLYAEGLSDARILKYLSQLNILSKNFDKDFDQITMSDMYRFLAELERSDKKPWTKQGYKVTIKRFFRWLNGGKEPEMTEWIKTPIKQSDQMLPEELLTEEECMSMIDCANHPRDKAIAASWYDAGARVGEIGEAKIKHVVFDEVGAFVMVKGKTGMRRVRLVFSAPYIAKWLDIHPLRDDPDAPLWVNIGHRNFGKEMKYGAIRMVIKRTAKKAGIKKRVYNHLFRHSRATDYAGFMSQAQLEMHMGWKHGTRMSGTYLHLQGAQVDNTILEHYGLKEKQDKVSELTPRKCSRCKTTNGPTADFCSSCGMALNAAAATNIDGMQQLGMQLLLEIGAKDPKDAQELQSYLGKLKEALSDSTSTSISDE
ncbi:MAG: tyrosine-type recombinase/integrase [Methanolobus sp.]|nr:tyrosine-type recombinase/integrase [Methanolobus sp.]